MADQPTVSSQFSIDPQAHIGVVALTIADLVRSVHFYTMVLGFELLEHATDQAVLGIAQTPLLVLHEQKGVAPRPQHTTGLYHFAILVPTRLDLGRALKQLVVAGYPLSGHADHLVSEALYLSDPDGNGIEIYRDRPRSTWRWNNGQVQMAADPIDLKQLLAEAGDAARPGFAAGTIIGHMHLQIGDVGQAEAFYHGVLGFDVMARWLGALFVGAGGYHHHLGLNTWHSRNAPPQPADAAGLRTWTINVSNVGEQQRIVARLEAANVPYTLHEQVLLVDDPWANRVALTPDKGVSDTTALAVADRLA